MFLPKDRQVAPPSTTGKPLNWWSRNIEEVNRYLKYLASLAFLFALFTTSYASWVCVGKIPDSKDYAIFRSGVTVTSADCTYFPQGNAYCCANITPNKTLSVYYVLNSNKEVERTYSILYSDVNGVSIVKAFTRYEAYITLSGSPGRYIIRENIPKGAVESASDILMNEGIILNYDPVIAWIVNLKGDGPSVVSYTVKRGSVPDVLPSIKLADCDLKIKPLDKGILEREGKYYLVYSFEVLYDGNRIIPPPRHTEITVNGHVVGFKVDPETRALDVITPLAAKGGEKVPIKIKVSISDCSSSYSDLVKVVSRNELSSLIPLIFLILISVAVAYVVWRRWAG